MTTLPVDLLDGNPNLNARHVGEASVWCCVERVGSSHCLASCATTQRRESFQLMTELEQLPSFQDCCTALTKYL